VRRGTARAHEVTRDTCDELETLVNRTAADELMLTTTIPGLGHRLRPSD